jgi:hypothetical protein
VIAESLAFVALVVAVAAPLLGHQGEPFPPARWWRTLRHADASGLGDGRSQAPKRS